MQLYHLDSEGIPEYINEIEDDQARSERSKNLIIDATLIIIATNAMLSTDKFPQSNEDWEELDVSQRKWERWKTTYRTAEKRRR